MVTATTVQSVLCYHDNHVATLSFLCTTPAVPSLGTIRFQIRIPKHPVSDQIFQSSNVLAASVRRTALWQHHTGIAGLEPLIHSLISQTPSAHPLPTSSAGDDSTSLACTAAPPGAACTAGFAAAFGSPPCRAFKELWRSYVPRCIALQQCSCGRGTVALRQS